MTHLISYDLVGKDEDYPRLWAALRNDGAVKILYSEWLISTTENAAQLRDRYKQHIDGNDRLFVCAIDDWASFNIMNRDQALILLPR